MSVAVKPRIQEIETKVQTNQTTSEQYQSDISTKAVDLKYPSDLGTPGHEAFIMFRILDPVKLTGGKPTVEKTIAIYLPPTLKASYNANYEDVEGTFAQFAAAVSAQKDDLSGTKWLDVLMGNEDAQMRQRFENAKAMGASGIDSLMGSDLRRQAEISNRKLVNPHMAVAFTGIPFRKFSFSFSMLARNQIESTQIREIIKEFKRAMHPSIGAGSEQRFWFYPKNFEIHLFAPVQGNFYMFQIDTCALIACDTDYAGSGAPSFFAKTGAPVDVRLDLSFQELRPLTAEDFTGENNF